MSKLQKLIILSLLMMICFVGNLQAQSSTITRLSPKEFQQKMAASDGFYLLDIRTAFEFSSSRIEDATHVSFLTPIAFSRRTRDLDKDAPIFVYDQTGHRSTMAVNRLRKMGFREIYELEGGFKAWTNKKFPTDE